MFLLFLNINVLVVAVFVKFVSIPYDCALFANLKGKKLEPVVAVEPLGVHLVVAAAVATIRPIRTTNADQRSFPFLVEIDADDDDSLIKTLNKDKEMK